MDFSQFSDDEYDIFLEAEYGKPEVPVTSGVPKVPRMRPGDSYTRPMTPEDRALIEAGQPLPREDALHAWDPRRGEWDVASNPNPYGVEPKKATSTNPDSQKRAPIIDIAGPASRPEALTNTTQATEEADPLDELARDEPHDYTSEARRFVNSSNQLYGYDPGPQRGHDWENDYLANTPRPANDTSALTTFFYGPEAGEKVRQARSQQWAQYQQGLNAARHADMNAQEQGQTRTRHVENEIGQMVRGEAADRRAQLWLEQARRNKQGQSTRTLDTLTPEDWSAVDYHVGDELTRATGRKIDGRMLGMYNRSGNAEDLPPDLRSYEQEAWRARTQALNGVLSTASVRAQLTPGLAGNAAENKERRTMKYSEPNIKAMSGYEDAMRSAMELRDMWKRASPKVRKAIVQTGMDPLSQGVAEALFLGPEDQVLARAVQDKVNQYINQYSGVAVNNNELSRTAKATGMTEKYFNPFRSPQVFESFVQQSYQSLARQWKYRRDLASDRGQGM